MFFGRTDAKAETPILCLPHVKSWLIGKDPDAGRDWGQEEKGMTENEMAGWHHWLDGHEFGWTLGVGDGQRGLACCNSWGHKESDRTEWLNWTEIIFIMKTRALHTVGAQLFLFKMKIQLSLWKWMIYYDLNSRRSLFFSKWWRQTHGLGTEWLP